MKHFTTGDTVIGWNNNQEPRSYAQKHGKEIQEPIMVNGTELSPGEENTKALIVHREPCLITLTGVYELNEVE